MTDLEKQLLDNPNVIKQKIRQVEQEEVDGSRNEDTHQKDKEELMKEFSWKTSYRLSVSANPQYALDGYVEVKSLKEALAYQEGEDALEYDECEWNEDAEYAFSEIDVDEVEVVIDEWCLHNPSKDYLELLESKKQQQARVEIIKTLTRCLKHSGFHPDEFHVFMDEVIEENPEFKDKFNFAKR